LETYVGNVTGTGSQSFGLGLGRRGRCLRHRCHVIDARVLGVGQPDRSPGALLLHHQPTGQEPGREQDGGDRDVGVSEAAGDRDREGPGDGEQQEGEHPTSTPGRLAGRGATGGVLLVGGGDDGCLVDQHGAAGRRLDEPGLARADGLAAGQDPHAMGEPVDGTAPLDVVVMTKSLGDQVGGPGNGQGHEDESAQVHDPTLGSLPHGPRDVNWCVAKSLL
jgi:hypothetical protein